MESDDVFGIGGVFWRVLAISVIITCGCLSMCLGSFAITLCRYRVARADEERDLVRMLANDRGRETMRERETVCAHEREADEIARMACDIALKHANAHN